jgi:hypothetical protein
MYGAQLGIEMAWLVTVRTWIDMDLKGAILHDRVNLNSMLTQNLVATPDNTDTLHNTVFLGDLQLAANWQMTPSLTLRAGYQALWFDGLALAQNQIRSPLINNAPGPFDDAGKACVHGPTLGLTAYW